MDKDYLRSPVVPNSPAPAYTPLAHTATTYHCAPVIEGRLGDIELETVDGKKFLVHKAILEAETVFFHIYYGFVPVWRMNGAAPAPYHTSAAPSIPPSLPQQLDTHSSEQTPQTFAALSSLRKIITSTLAPSNTISASSSSSQSNTPPPPPPFASPTCDTTGVITALGRVRGPVTAPTPTASPFTWLVPESSSILTAFLSLIYPRGTILSPPTAGLETIDITGRVIRAALGYQSTKALTLARDHLSQQRWLTNNSLEVYLMACFYKFGDLAKLASFYAIKVPKEDWQLHRSVMGRTGLEQLAMLYDTRLQGLCGILDRSLSLGQDPEDMVDHHIRVERHECDDNQRLKEMWASRVEEVKMGLGAGSGLEELLGVDMRGGWCEGCLVILGQTIRNCIVEARELPVSI